MVINNSFSYSDRLYEHKFHTWVAFCSVLSLKQCSTAAIAHFIKNKSEVWVMCDDVAQKKNVLATMDASATYHCYGGAQHAITMTGCVTVPFTRTQKFMGTKNLWGQMMCTCDLAGHGIIDLTLLRLPLHEIQAWISQRCIVKASWTASWPASLIQVMLSIALPKDLWCEAPATVLACTVSWCLHHIWQWDFK